MATSVLWFRRDLRLADNPALLAARQAECLPAGYPPALVDHASERKVALAGYETIRIPGRG